MGGLFAVVGSLLLVAGMMDAGPLPIPARAAATPALPLAIAAPHASIEHFRGNGRTFDHLVATPPADPHAAILAAVTRAHHASRAVRGFDRPASARILDLRADLVIMAAAQRGSRRPGSCHGASEELAPCSASACCGPQVILSDSDETRFLNSVPPDVLFGLQLRPPHDPEPSARAADNRVPPKGDDDPNALIVATASLS
jgi:hypothetical protein